MNGKQQVMSCPCPKTKNDKCTAGSLNKTDNATPLSKACGCERFKVCKVSGDRQLCARMAQLGVLPGSEIELVCPAHEQNCMVRVMGCTVSLDQLSADNILVTPV